MITSFKEPELAGSWEKLPKICVCNSNLWAKKDKHKHTKLIFTNVGLHFVLCAHSASRVLFLVTDSRFNKTAIFSNTLKFQ